MQPDVYILGKALGGGIVPLSAVVADRDVLGVLTPGSHGSTFGGNPLACAVGREVSRCCVPASTRTRAATLGERAAPAPSTTGRSRSRARSASAGCGPASTSPIRPVSGRRVCELLLERGVLAKDAHGHTLRLAPPIVIAESDLDFAVDQLVDALAAAPRVAARTH